MDRKIITNRRMLSIVGVVSLVWLLLAIYYIATEGLSSVAVLYLGTGSTWICLGMLFFLKRGTKKTIKYYDENAEQFVASTEDADVTRFRERFVRRLPEGARILDWGCGSGRDAAAFLQMGFAVEASDGSANICRLASEKTGIKVRCERFDELDAKAHYDGIWACASLLHLSAESLLEALELAARALKPAGVLYASFKYGTGEGERGGRYFTDMTEERFAKYAKHLRRMEILEQWISTDVRPEREGEMWLNVMMRKL